MKADADPSEFTTSLRSLWIAGFCLVLAFFGAIGAWSVLTVMTGAVVSQGQFVVDGNVKKVQHPTGGVVGELFVHDGTRVEQGAVLIRLDDTVTRANLQVVTKQLDELVVRRERLEAERDRLPAFALAGELEARASDPQIAKLLASEKTMFEARRVARDGQKAQLEKRIAQLKEEIVGLRAQQTARVAQAALIAEELVSVRKLYKQNLVALTRKNALEREAASLEGQRGQLIAAIAQSEGKIAETNLQILQIENTLREDVTKELRETLSKIGELVERRVAAEDQLKRIEIRAPSAGFVHQLAVHTVGAVISPAETIMLIVPSGEALQIEARIAPTDIDQVKLGHAARVRIHAFNRRTTPELDGTVSRISADTSRDTQTGVQFYTVRVEISPSMFDKLSPEHVTAGMVADVFISTEDRSPLTYLIKPLTDQIAKAFRER